MTANFKSQYRLRMYVSRPWLSATAGQSVRLRELCELVRWTSVTHRRDRWDREVCLPFRDWIGGVVSTSRTVIISMDGNKDVTARFR